MELENTIVMDGWIVKNDIREYLKRMDPNGPKCTMRSIYLMTKHPTNHKWNLFFTCAAFGRAMDACEHATPGTFCRVTGKLGYKIYQEQRYYSIIIDDLKIHSEQIPMPQHKGVTNAKQKDSIADSDTPF